MTSDIHWTKHAAQQLVRYEALFNLLDDIQGVEDVADLAGRVAAQWKYFTNITSWRLVVENDGVYLVIDGLRGEARVATAPALSPWDSHHWDRRRPQRVSTAEPPTGPAAPAHLAANGIIEIQVLPFMRTGRCAGLLSAAAHRERFSKLDLKFIRIFGGHLTDRIAGILLSRQVMQTLIDRATYDNLTGLLNRPTICDRLASQLALAGRSGLPLCVIFGDIDFFKCINDQYGHDVGDEVLREVARRLQAQTRESDCLARYGGEEFLNVLYPCTVDEVALAAERLRTAVAATPFVIAGVTRLELNVTISLGTASTAEQAGIPMERLLKQADEALYRAKAGGRNRVSAAKRISGSEIARISRFPHHC